MFYDVFIRMCAQKNVTPSKAAEDIGLNRAAVSKWQKGGKPSAVNLLKLSNYFGVTTDYLLDQENHSEEKTETPPALTKKDERDISRRIDQILADLESQQTGLMFDGEPLDDETKELLAISLRNSMETSKIWAKKKFTPKKYRKDE